MTTAERRLWQALRGHRFEGRSFRRQHPVGPYVLDFYCPALRLAVELDGGQHARSATVQRDDRRTRWLNARGIQVVRYWNNDVTENLNGVLAHLSAVCAEHQKVTLPLARGRAGEGVAAQANHANIPALD